MDTNKTQYARADLNPDELKQFNIDLQAFLDEKMIDLTVSALVESNGTLGGRMIAYKRVELVPKEGGTLVPKTVEQSEEESNEEERLIPPPEEHVK